MRKTNLMTKATNFKVALLACAMSLGAMTTIYSAEAAAENIRSASMLAAESVGFTHVALTVDDRLYPAWLYIELSVLTNFHEFEQQDSAGDSEATAISYRF